MKSSLQITKDLLRSFCGVAFYNLQNYLKTKNIAGYPTNLPKFKSPLFVTWKTGKQQELRGCIGTFAHDDFDKNLPRYSLISAVQDTRFPPITEAQLKDLCVVVSVLTDFQQAKDPMDWEIGKHGIIIQFGKSLYAQFKSDNVDDYNATYLPEVAKLQNWDHKATLQSLCKKSGYKGTLESVIDSMKVKRYQSKLHQINYEQYLEMKDTLFK